MPQSIELQIQNIKCDHLPESPWATSWVKKLFSVKLFLDGIEYDTGPIKGSTTVLWSDKFSLQALGSSSLLEIEVYDHHLISKRIEVIGHSKDTVHNLLKESSSAVRIRRTMNRRSGVELTFSISLQDSNICPLVSSLEPSETPCTNNPASVNASMDSDEHSNSVLLDQHPPAQDDRISQRERGDEIELAEQIGGSAKLVDTLTPFAVSLSALLDKMKPFVEIGDKLAEIHPYAKIAWSILSLVPKSIIAQRERDESLCNLMEIIKDVHSFLAEFEPLEIVDSQRKIAEDMGRLTVESAHLIRHYTVNENFWKRAATLALSEAVAKIQKIQDQLKELKDAFQFRAVAHIEITVFQILDRTKDIGIDNTLDHMPYGNGGRYNSDKGCLPGTRTAVLDELHRLINLPDGDGTPRLLVLTGVAGCGKSAIAHTVAQHYDRTKRLGSSVFFAQAGQQLECHSSNLLSTVARDISDLDTRWKVALYEIVKESHSLRTTNVIPEQMDKFIVGPAKALSIIGPVVIVVDALDKSGSSKGDLIRSFMKRASDLPSNFRILITAPLESGFSNNQHVKIIPIETLGDANIDSDIFKFIQSKLASIADMLERKLASVADMLPTNSGQWCHSLVFASDHSFEWAAAASRAIIQGKDDDAQVKILRDIIRNKRTLHELYTTIRDGESNQNESKVIPFVKRPCESLGDQITTTPLPLTPGCAVAQLPRVPSVPPSDQITTVYLPADPFFKSTNSTARSIFEVIGFVQCMKTNQMLSVISKDLPETLASLERTLEFMHRAIRVYQHTTLVQSLSNAISKGVEECRQVLNELQSNLANYRYEFYPAMINFIQTYIWGGIGQGAPVPVHALDSKLRKCHSSFVACLLALGRAQWPELKRGLGKETLEELEIFYEELKRETTSLQHVKVDTVIVLDHLGRTLPVPMVFCMSQQDFHVVITGFCRGLAGDVLIRRGNYRIFNSEDDQAINPEEFATILQPGMAVDMSIAFYEQAEDRQGSEGYKCPRCQHVNSRCSGWMTCAKCNGSFKISPEDESSIVSPEIEHATDTDSIPNERPLFRKISIFQARAPMYSIQALTPFIPPSADLPAPWTPWMGESRPAGSYFLPNGSYVPPPRNLPPQTPHDGAGQFSADYTGYPQSISPPGTLYASAYSKLAPSGYGGGGGQQFSPFIPPPADLPVPLSPWMGEGQQIPGSYFAGPLGLPPHTPYHGAGQLSAAYTGYPQDPLPLENPYAAAGTPWRASVPMPGGVQPQTPYRTLPGADYSNFWQPLPGQYGGGGQHPAAAAGWGGYPQTPVMGMGAMSGGAQWSAPPPAATPWRGPGGQLDMQLEEAAEMTRMLPGELDAHVETHTQLVSALEPREQPLAKRPELNANSRDGQLLTAARRAARYPANSQGASSRELAELSELSELSALSAL